MIFSIRNLGFELGSLLLEGWAAFAARVVCAALLLVLGWLVRQLLSRRVFPALLRRNWRLAGTPYSVDCNWLMIKSRSVLTTGRLVRYFST